MKTLKLFIKSILSKSILSFSIIFTAYSAFAHTPITIDEAVKGKVYRGPAIYTKEDFDVLKSHHIKTILNLKVTGSTEEENRARQYGIENYFNTPIIPMPWFFPLEP